MSTFIEEGIASLALENSGRAVESEVVKVHNVGEEASDSAACVPTESCETTCAICLNKIPAFEAAQPEECDHSYCACCILHWAVYKEAARCPQCKIPFSSLMTYRSLDGQYKDTPCRESLCLLKRTCWFQDHLKMREQAIAEAAAGRLASARIGRVEEGSVIDESDFIDYERYYEEYDDDEEVENYYFSAAAGRARIVIGNRRHGPNGFISSGRMQARPTPPAAQPKAKKAREPEVAGQSFTRKKSTESAEGSRTPSQKTPARPSSHKNQASQDLDTETWSGNSSGKQSAGRRARRNQRRAAADARAGL